MAISFNICIKNNIFSNGLDGRFSACLCNIPINSSISFVTIFLLINHINNFSILCIVLSLLDMSQWFFDSYQGIMPLQLYGIDFWVPFSVFSSYHCASLLILFHFLNKKHIKQISVHPPEIQPVFYVFLSLSINLWQQWNYIIKGYKFTYYSFFLFSIIFPSLYFFSLLVIFLHMFILLHW